MHLAYVTNNAARTPQTVAGQLTGFGLPTGPDDVITSAQAVARLIAEQVPPGARVLAIGGEGLRVALRERGLEPVESADDDPAAVVQGFDPALDWERLAEAAYAVQRGVPWFASNTDLTIPKERGIAPGNGALVEVVRTAAGGRRRWRASRSRRCTGRRCCGPAPAAAGDRRPARHRHRGRHQRRGGLAAGAHRCHHPRRTAGRPAAAPSRLRGRGPARAAGPAARGDRGRRRLPLWRLAGRGGRRRARRDGGRGRRWTGCGRCARRPGRLPGTAVAGRTRGRRWRGSGCERWGPAPGGRALDGRISPRRWSSRRPRSAPRSGPPRWRRGASSR